jgi:DNA-directed RNA polymerase specialized sigma24 family protein
MLEFLCPAFQTILIIDELMNSIQKKETTMNTYTSNSLSDNNDLSNNETWDKLYPKLRSRVRYLVYSYALPSWKGQEEDIIEDVVQETARRLIVRIRKAEHGEASPIQSIEHLMMSIAQHYCTDLWRRDRRVSRMLPTDSFEEINQDVSDSPFESGTERAYQERLFTLAAQEIAKFPDKQRTALLTDLANRMCFDIHPTPLQKAFLAAGVQLQQYCQTPSASPLERSRHLSLLSYAYKRVASLPCVQEYVAV